MNEITGEVLLKQMIELDPSNLDENAKKLFYKIMEVIDERDSLLKENQELIIQISAREEVANHYKERIDKISKIIYEIKELIEETGGYPSNYIDNLLDILKEVE